MRAARRLHGDGAMAGPTRRTLSEHIAHELRRLVAEGQLRPGDRLPPERELARLFGVSRVSVREALKTLASWNLLERRPGGGTFIRPLTTPALIDPLIIATTANRATLEDLMEARLCLEVELAGLAAQRRHRDDVVRLERAVRALERALASGGHGLRADLAFHTIIARVAGNAFLYRMYETTVGMTMELRRRTIRVPGALERTVVAHRLILAAIRNGDAEAARRAMREHLETVLHDLLRAFKRDEARR